MTELKRVKAVKYISEGCEYPPSSSGQQHYSIDATIEGSSIEVLKSYYATDFLEHTEEIAHYCKSNDVELILVDTQSIMDEFLDYDINLFIDSVYDAGLSVLFTSKKSDKDLYST